MMMRKECCNLNEVIEKFYNYLKAYIISKTNKPELAEDLVQEVMFKLVKAHQENKEIKNIKAWLFQVSRNTMFDYFKKENIEVNLDEDWKIDQISTENKSNLVVEDYILPMIQLLPEKYALPLKMSDIDNIPQKDIAEQLNIGLSALKMRLKRGRSKLHELFEECCDIEFDKQGNFMECTIKHTCEPLQNIDRDLKDKVD
jgi:RNA polymerase sigma-70 factor (ECF subfamily)